MTKCDKTGLRVNFTCVTAFVDDPYVITMYHLWVLCKYFKIAA